MQNHQTHFKYILSSEVFLFNLQILFDQARSQFGRKTNTEVLTYDCL